MRIKTHPSGNEYIRAGDVWVRNFTKSNLAPLQVTHMFQPEDYARVLQNQEMNKNHPKISNETVIFKKVVIVSDGHKFDERHKLISKLPRDVAILAVNEAMRKWGLMHPKMEPAERRTINAYVCNNPYPQAMTFLPSKDNKYYPTCIASVRANFEFLKKYLGDVYTYMPTSEEKFGHEAKEEYYIDDYRNPICAAIGLAHHFGVQKLMLLCCDESFEEKRDFAVELKNGLWTYPQHLKSQEIIDANLYWLTHQEEKEVKVADYSSGADYTNAAYITTMEEALDFFQDQEEGTSDD